MPFPRKPGTAVAVIGTATLVVAGVLLYTFRDHLYTFRDHDGPSPGTGRLTTPEAPPTPSTSRAGPTAIPGHGKAGPTGANPGAESDAVELGGYVRDEVTGQPLEGVDLSLLDYDDVHGKTPVCHTDPEGRFRFRNLPASSQPLKQVRLLARKEGYKPSDTYTSLGQNALPVTLQPVTAPEHDR